MNWAIERDNVGRPVRMVWMGWTPKKQRVADPPPGCPGCGLHFGWHKMGCEKRGQAHG